MNEFGGNWTKIKIEILVDYAKAYLQILNGKNYFQLLYFDGFAGSGSIIKDDKVDISITIGAAKRIVEIEMPRPFDSYYFVEKDRKNIESLKKVTQDLYPNKKYIYLRKTAMLN